MDWTTVLTSTVFAAATAALIGIINTFLINKSKSNDSLRLFRYTKLYEILHELTKANGEISEKDWMIALTVRKQNIVRSCGMARPLVNKEYWGDIDAKIETTNRILIEIIETGLIRELSEDFNKAIAETETAFNLAVEKQMRTLLKSR